MLIALPVNSYRKGHLFTQVPNQGQVRQAVLIAVVCIHRKFPDH